MKIQLIGHSGSGKSTLAKRLSDYYQLPLLHLDQLAFSPNWQLRPSHDLLSDLEYFLDQEVDWVIDGVYSKYHFERRLKEADLIIYLNLNRWLSLIRIIKRRFSFHGKTRPSAPAGCRERLDARFLRYALFGSRRPQRMLLFDEICQKYGDKVIILRNQKEIDQFLENNKRVGQNR